jgi:hypothetical protein
LTLPPKPIANDRRKKTEKSPETSAISPTQDCDPEKLLAHFSGDPQIVEPFAFSQLTSAPQDPGSSIISTSHHPPTIASTPITNGTYARHLVYSHYTVFSM